MKNTKWTKEEEEYLRENLKKVSVVELEKNLNRKKDTKIGRAHV